MRERENGLKTLSILMFCPQFRPIIGGAERQAEKLSVALAQKGCRVTILTPHIVKGSKPKEEIDGVCVERFPLYDIRKQYPWIKGVGLLNLLLLKRQVMRAVKKTASQYDIVHAHNAAPLTEFAMEAAMKLKKPVLCKVASAGDNSDISQVKKIGLGGERIAHRMLTRMPCWIATTAFVENTLISYGISNEKIIRIPNGVVIKKQTNRNWKGSNSPARFLYLGRISTGDQRDVPSLIKAFDLLAEDYPEVELGIVGGGSLFKETKSLVKRTKNKSRIFMPGYQEPEPWLQWANCYVQPSRREGLSNSLIEAMSHGLACIANDIPPNREVLDNGKSGFLTPIGDVDGLLKLMRLLASSPDQIMHWGSLAKERAMSTYSIEKVADNHLKLYEDLLSGRLQ